MKANFSLLSIILFSIILSCQSPAINEQVLLNELYNNLIEQRKYTYEVAYSEGFLNEKPSFILFGTGKLTRNSDRSISRFYFGPKAHKKEHAFFALNNAGYYTEQIKSTIYEESSADVLADSLQSAILLNPEILLNLIETKDKLEVCQVKGGLQFEFYNKTMKRHLIIESDKENKLLSKVSIHQKAYNNRDYVRSWSFNFLNKDEYQVQLAICEKQYEDANRLFL